MSLYFTQIEKHRFVCGLFWQSLSRPRELKKEAADLAGRLDFDLMVLRNDQSTAQAGFAQTKEGAKRGVYSLAAAVSKTVALEGAHYDGRKQRVHNWLGAFKLPDGMWIYLAVRDANFLPNGDFAGTKEEVLDRLHGDYGLGGWNVVIGDPELANQGFHNFNAKRIEDMLPHTRGGQIRAHKWWGLHPVKTSIRWRGLIAASCVLAAAGTAGTMYWQHQKKLEEEARQRAFEEMRRKLQTQSVPKELPHPWIDKPAPQDLTQACVDGLTHLTAGGWQLDEYACNGNTASYTWSRQGSAIEYLLEQVPGANISLSGETATYSERLDLGRGKDDQLQGQKELLEPLQSRMQLMGLKIKILQQEQPAPPPPSAAGAVMGQQPIPLPTWKTFTYALEAGGVPPAEIAAMLSQPGVRIDKLAYRGGAWTIEGVMYAK